VKNTEAEAETTTKQKYKEYKAYIKNK